MIKMDGVGGGGRGPAGCPTGLFWVWRPQAAPGGDGIGLVCVYKNNNIMQ